MTTICYFVKIRDVVSKSWTHSGFSVNDSHFLTYICIYLSAAASLQSCPTLCDPIDGSPTGSAIPGILQARTLEWVAISFSSAWKWKVKVKSLSRARLLATPWTAAYQASPSMGFSRQECWSGLPLPSPKRSKTPEKTKKTQKIPMNKQKIKLLEISQIHVIT